MVFVFGYFPGDEGPLGQFGGEKGLADSSDDPRGSHRLEAFNDGFKGLSAFPGNDMEGAPVKSLHLVFGNRQDGRIDRVCGMDGDGIHNGAGGMLRKLYRRSFVDATALAVFAEKRGKKRVGFLFVAYGCRRTMAGADDCFVRQGIQCFDDVGNGRFNRHSGFAD